MKIWIKKGYHEQMRISFIYIYVIYLHKTSLMSRYLHVELNTLLSRVQYVLQIDEKMKSTLFFCPNLISTSFKQTFKIAKNT